MSEPISPKLFAHLADLAALKLGAEESEYLRAELNKQLKSIEELAAIPLDENVSTTSHGVPYAPTIRPELREDHWQASGISPDILAQVPETDEGYIVVPDIPHEELE